jgi:hypothetical protein
MATFPLATCARMLGIHPKTLHRWLGEANAPLAPHPTDARLKCLTEEHLLQLARLHSRPLPELTCAPQLSGCSAPGSPEEQAALLFAHEAEPASPAVSQSAPCAAEVDLVQRLSCLETKIVTLQGQLAQLALGLLHERERTVEPRLAALEALLQALVGGQMPPDPHEQEAKREPAGVSPQRHQPLAVEQRARSRMPALIEYGAQGSYVIISSQEGELYLVPESADWFEWLASISSFRFVGKQGRFTAYRDTKHGHPTRSWRAYRTIHQHNYKHSLGVTEQLTITRLERVAALLQAPLDTL